MGTLRAAIDALAGLVFTGVISNYDLDQRPPQLSGGELPALVVRLLPSRAGQDTQAATVLVYDGSAYWVTYHVEHVCYWMPVGAGRPGDFMPNMYTFVDNYMAKVAGNGKLGNLDEYLVVLTVDVAQFGYPETDSKTRYWGVRFLHRWRMKVVGVP